MFKNINLSELFKSKTFYGAVFYALCDVLTVVLPENAPILNNLKLLGGLLATIGIIDRTKK
jgi:hypothetical protein